VKSKKNLNNFSELGNRVRELREGRGLQQKDLASILGYQNNTSVSKIELGIKPPSADDFIKLAQSLNVDLHWLITGRLSPLFTGMVKELVRGTHRLAINACDGQKFLLETRIDLRDKIDRLQRDPAGNKAEIDRLSKLLNDCDEAYKRSVEVVADFEKKSDVNDILNRCLSAFEDGLRPKDSKQNP